MLAGLMSRWTSPRVWAWCRASATAATSSADSRNDGRPVSILAARSLPVDELRDDVAEAVVGPAHVVDRDDVRVVELGEDAGLGQVRLDVLGPATRSGLGTLIATGRSSSSSWAR